MEEYRELNRGRIGIICGVVGISLNILLFVFKYIAGVLTSSIAITADAFNNLSDAGSSFITMVGFILSGKKPDEEHPFGHARFEYISGLLVSLAILLMGFELAKSSIYKIIHPENIDTKIIAMIILVVSILVKLIMAIYNTVIGKKIGSSAMKATALDSLSDIVTTSVVLACVIIARFTGLNLDGISGLFVAVLIGIAGISAAKDTISPLLGEPPSEEFVERIEKLVMAHEGIIGIHDLVVHDYGPGRLMISLHAEVPGDGDIFVIHDLIDNVENELNEKLGCEATIHMDPVQTNDEYVDDIRKKVNCAIKKIDGKLSMHDFRMVTGPTHTNLIFDVVVPYSVKEENAIIRSKIEEMVKKIDEKFEVVIRIDKSFVK